MNEATLIETNEIKSPCIRHCCLDEADICLGCFRSLHEITGWWEADQANRQTILIRAEQRRAQHRSRWPGTD